MKTKNGTTNQPALCLIVIASMLSGFNSVAEISGEVEVPPVLKASEMAPADVVLKGDRYRVDDEVPTDGFLATFTIRSDFGTIKASGPGVLRLRIAEVDALEKLEKMETSDVFVDAMKRSASSLGSAVENLATNTAEVAKAIPQSVGRFFERVGRQTKTAVQKLDDVRQNKDPGAARGAAPSTNDQNLAVAGGVATGMAVRDMLGYDEERRHLAKELNVDPYSTNPVLKKRLDDVAWAAFAGGLGVDAVARAVPGGRIVKSTSTVSDWIYEKPPGDLKVWIEKTLTDIGVDQETIDLFLRIKSFTLTTQTALVMALDRMKDVEGRDEVIHTAVTLETEDQARFLALGMSLLAREHERAPLASIIDGRPIGKTKKGHVVATMPVDYVSWTEKTAAFTSREDLLALHPRVYIPGKLSPRTRLEMEKAGWEIQEGVPLKETF